MNKKTMQKHDPFAINDETHCGDCNKTLTDKRGRVASAVFDHGVRCEKCHKLASDKRRIAAWLAHHDMTLDDVGVSHPSKVADLSDPDVIQSLIDDIEEEEASR